MTGNVSLKQKPAIEVNEIITQFRSCKVFLVSFYTIPVLFKNNEDVLSYKGSGILTLFILGRALKSRERFKPLKFFSRLIIFVKTL